MHAEKTHTTHGTKTWLLEVLGLWGGASICPKAYFFTSGVAGAAMISRRNRSEMKPKGDEDKSVLAWQRGGRWDSMGGMPHQGAWFHLRYQNQPLKMVPNIARSIAYCEPKPLHLKV